MFVPYDKTFLLVPNFLTLWPWPWSLTHFSKTLTLAISFEWQVIWLSYLISVFFTTKPFYWYQIFWPCDLDLEVWHTFQKLYNIDHIFWMASDNAFIFHMSVPYDKTFLLTLWPWPWSSTRFSKTLTLAISFEWQVIGLSYFICVYLMTSPFYWYQIFDLVTLTLKFHSLF
jgi:hypothetical protein